MIYGIGVDIVSINRMRTAVSRWGDKFLRRIFTAGEIEYCYNKKDPCPSLSVRFAAKEALIKAISSELPVSLTDIEIVTSPEGKPFLKVKGNLETFFSDRSIIRAHLTLSHEREYGVACVVLEEK